MTNKKTGAEGAASNTDESQARKESIPPEGELQAVIERLRLVIDALHSEAQRHYLNTLDILGNERSRKRADFAKRSLVDAGLFLRVFFDTRRGRYWLRTEDGFWKTRPAAMVKTFIRAHGIDARKNLPNQLSQLDHVLMFLSCNRSLELPLSVEKLFNDSNARGFSWEQVEKLVTWETSTRGGSHAE